MLFHCERMYAHTLLLKPFLKLCIALLRGQCPLIQSVRYPDLFIFFYETFTLLGAIQIPASRKLYQNINESKKEILINDR